MDSANVHEIFIKTRELTENKPLKLYYEGFCLFSFSNFTFGFHSFHFKKINVILELENGRKFSCEQ